MAEKMVKEVAEMMVEVITEVMVEEIWKRQWGK